MSRAFNGTKEKLPDIRCGHCGRKLGEGHYSELAIKCPRCGTLNYLTALSQPSARHGTPLITKGNDHDRTQTTSH